MARTGGPFPFPVANASEGGSKIALASGGVFYPPPGDWIAVTDAHSLVQFWDPIQQVWQTFVGTSNVGTFTADGFNFRILNNSGIVNSVTISTVGSSQTNGIGATATGVTAAIATSNTTGGANATAYVIVGGSVAAPAITQAGSGFKVPPLIVFDPPPLGGIQATATCALSATGTIASVTMLTVGAGYTSTPNVWVLPQADIYQGSTSGGAAAGVIPPPGLVNPTNAVPGNQNTATGTAGVLLTPAALTGSGTITGIVIINSGGGYTSAAPTVTVTSTAGNAGTAVGVVSNTSPTTATILLQPRVPT